MRWRTCLLSTIPLVLVLFFPATALAHAILLRSDPAPDSILQSAPTQVRMWFSEDLNPTSSTAYVVNAKNSSPQTVADVSTHVDAGDAHVSASDPKEMDLSIKSSLPPAVYIVFYQTQSAEDGHVLHGTFLFTVAEANGTVPTYNGTIPNVGSTVTGSTGQLDSLGLLSLITLTLVELGVVFWMGAQLWHNFVLRVNEDQEQFALYQSVERRFERVYAIPALLLLLLANIGVLLAQALSLTQTGQHLSFPLLLGLVSHGQFGFYWLVRQIVVLLALALAVYAFIAQKRPHWIDELLPWLNLVLGLALLTAMALSSHAAATSRNIVMYAVLSDWLHLLAASLWIGGMLYLATTYLPLIQRSPISERTRSLLKTLALYSPLALTGVIVMAATGPFNAAVRLDSWSQFLTTAYGRTLIVKILLVVALLITSAIHVGFMRPRLKKSHQQYLTAMQAVRNREARENYTLTDYSAEQIKRLESNVTTQTDTMIRVLRWEPVLGIAVLLCTGLLNVFAGTLQPALPITSPNQPARVTPAKQGYTTSVKTRDGKFTLKLSVTPNLFGPNTFTVTVLDNSGKPTTNVGVSLYTTMLDMDMGTDQLNLQPDGKGHFTATGDLSMSGHWQVRLEIRTPDNTTHEATVRFSTQS